MDMSVVFLMIVAFLGCGMVAGLLQTMTVVVRQRHKRRNMIRQNNRKSA
jgi:hypothetical protein